MSSHPRRTLSRFRARSPLPLDWLQRLERRRLLSATFENTAPIVTPDCGPATTYPATISVAGLDGAVSRVTATLNDLSHTYPDDYDVLLVGPGGQSVVLMSDTGGGYDAVHRTLTFDDAAPSYLPNEGPLLSNGAFKPTNIGLTGDLFPAPAPILAPSGAALSVFNGTNPNGDWKLFVVDDYVRDSGSIGGGWSIAIDTVPALPPTVAAITPAPGSAINSAGVNVDVTFSEPVVGVDASDLSIGGSATASGLAAVGEPTLLGGNTWRFPVSGLVDGTLTLNLAADADAIENAAGADVPNTPWTLTVDLTPPTATWTAVSPNPRTTAAGVVTVTFSEAVSNIDASDFQLTRDGSPVSLAGVTPTAVSPTKYTLDLAPVSGLAGNYSLTLADGGAGITDLAGNALASGATTSWTMNAINGTDGDDTIRLVRSNSSAAVDVYVNNNTATPDYSVLLSGLGSAPLNVLGGGGDDMIVVDLGNGTVAPSAGITVDGGAGANALTVKGTSGNDWAIYTSTEIDAAAAAVRYSNGRSARFAGGAGYDTLTIREGEYAFDADAASESQHLALRVEAAGGVDFGSTQHLASLWIQGYAAIEQGSDTIVVTSDLAISGAGYLDLADGTFVLDYSSLPSPIGSWNGSSYQGIAGLLASGCDGGKWDGGGIVSSSTDGGSMSVSVAEASQVLGIKPGQTALFHAETVDATAVIVMYTYGGDANLDGKVNVDDYGRIDFNVALPGVAGWINGDFNYDGKINVDDYGIIDFNVSLQHAPAAINSASTESEQLFGSVPQPPAAEATQRDPAGLIDDLFSSQSIL